MGVEPNQEKVLPEATKVTSTDRGASASVQIVPEDGEVHRRGRLDMAAEYLKQQEINQREYTETEARRVLWKIDLVVTTLCTCTVTLCAVDKIIVSNASVFGMSRDAHLHGQQYSWVASIFYFGYLVAQAPCSLLIQRYPVGKLIGVAAIAWGAMVALMGACHNAAGLLTLRFLTGIFEAPMFPVCAVMTVMWYKKEEQPLRTAFWFGHWSSVVGGIVSYGIGQIKAPIANWRLLFIIMGCFTICWGVFLWFFMPDTPMECKFLNDREKFIAVHRVKDNMTGISQRTIKWYQIREALTDWKVWPLAVYCLCLNIANGGFYSFSGQIISGLGFSSLNTTLLNMPVGLVATFSSMLLTVPGTKFRNARCITAVCFCVVPIACLVAMMKIPIGEKYKRLGVYYPAFTYWAGYPLVSSLPMANTSGHSKKVAVNAIMFLAYCVGNILAPQFFRAKEAPKYTTAYRAILSGIVIGNFCLIVYAIGIWYENKKKAKAYGESSNEALATEDKLLDVTDREKEGFTYIY